MNAVLASLAPLRARWAALAARERLGLGLAAAAVLLYALWALAIEPAWRTLNRAPAEIEALDAQLQTMQRLAAEATELRAAPPVSLEQANAALRSATERVGEQGRLAVQGDRVVFTLTGLGTSAFSGWMAEARSGARARPIEAMLVRAAQGYNGTVVLTLSGGGP